MAAPPGVTRNRWDQAVRAIARDTGWTSDAVDAWLNAVWADPTDEVRGWIDGHARLKAWLIANQTEPSGTLPMAFVRWVT